jgi:hypothetical protein
LKEYSKGLKDYYIKSIKLKNLKIIKKILLGAAKALKEFHECGKNFFLMIKNFFYF